MKRRDLEIVSIRYFRFRKRVGTPLYKLLYAHLKEQIENGTISGSARIPSTRDLSAELGLSKSTINSAIDQLVTEGYLERFVGRGTFVCSNLNDFAADLSRKASQPQREKAKRSGPAPAQVSCLGARATEMRSAWRPLQGTLPFRPGMPAVDAFPLREYERLAKEAIRYLTPAELCYGHPQGLESLRTQTAKYLVSARGVRACTENVFVFSGVQQAVYLIGQLCMNPGDKVLFEEPGYTSSRQAFQCIGAQIIPMAVDECGATLQSVPSRVLRRAKLAYLTPTHQYPTGATLSIDRRMRILEWATDSNALIIEDDYDSEFRYIEHPIPAMQGLDKNDNTIYLGSFSKSLFPAASIAYAVVPERIIEPLTHLVRLATRPPAIIEQKVVARFLREGHFYRHLRRMRKVYAERRAAFVAGLEKHLGHIFETVSPPAGLNCVADIRSKHSEKHIVNSLHAGGILCRGLSEYSIGSQSTSTVTQVTKRNALVFGFASGNPTKIDSSLMRCAELLV